MRRLALPVRLAHMVAEAARTGQRSRSRHACRAVHRARAWRRQRRSRTAAARGSEREIAARHGRAPTRRAAGDRPYPPPGRTGETRGSPRVDPQAHGVGVAALAPTPSPRLAAQDRCRPSTREQQCRLPAHPCLAGPRRQGARRARPVRARQWRGRHVDAADPLAGEKLPRRRRPQGKAQNARIASAAAVAEADIRAVLAEPSSGRRETSVRPRQKRAVRVRETVRLGAIVLAERMLPAPAGADADRAILDALARARACAAAVEQGGRNAAPAAGLAASRARRALARCLRRRAGRARWTIGCCRFSRARRPSPAIDARRACTRSDVAGAA